jgi:hypothetical protein
LFGDSSRFPESKSNEALPMHVILANTIWAPVLVYCDDCPPLRGHFLDRAVAWKGGSLAALAGKPVRLCFMLGDADLFSLL